MKKTFEWSGACLESHSARRSSCPTLTLFLHHKAGSVVEDGWLLRRAAECFQVSVPTAALGRPLPRTRQGRHSGPFQPTLVVSGTDPAPNGRAVVALRVNRRWESLLHYTHH
jgi:hypothetical protein